jgi:predicted XRE-type DNA-binding protein
MARQSAKKRPANTIVRGNGNVFADLNLPDAEVRQTKLWLVCALNAVIDAQRLTQDEAAKRLGLNQPKTSALRNYKLEGFSVERLMMLRNALDRDIEIVILTRAEQGKAAAAAESDEMRRELARRIEGIAAAQRGKEAGGAQ